MSEFSVSRSTTIAAPAAKVFPLIDNFREWQNWSPWEGIDPNLQREYSGPDAGVGAKYAWHGNKKVGSGSMEIAESTPNEAVAIKLIFTAPWKAENDTVFALVEKDGETSVSWTMSGQRPNNILGLVMRVLPIMDRFIAKDFDKGLAQLKALAEA